MIEPPPTLLHKFYSLEGGKFEQIKQLLSNNVIYFSKCDEFNDPWECKPSFRYQTSPTSMGDYFYRLISRLKPEIPEAKRRQDANAMGENWLNNPEQHLSDISMIQSQILAKYGIFCMSASKTHPLLWAHYASGHRGLCLTFATDASQKAFYYAQRVIYQKDYPVAELDGEDFQQLYNASLLTKSDDWSYEQEWRLCWKERSGLQSFPPDALVALSFGAMIDSIKRDEIISLVNARSHRPALFSAAVNSKSYSLDFTTIS